ESFSQEIDVKLFKLHGSIIWYLTNEGNYLKLPILINAKSAKIENAIELISEEIAKPFILYPMANKSEFAEPLNILTNQFQNYLKTAKICIVVGYSFRDKDIRRIFFEIAKHNESLTIILISPDAGKTFEERLKYYDNEKRVLSSLSEKVVCWNYTFGPVLKDYYLYRNLQATISPLKAIYAQTENARRNGAEHWRSNFKECIELAIKLEDTVTIEKILKKELGVSSSLIEFESIFSEKEQFRLMYSLAFLYLFNSNGEYKQYFNQLSIFLHRINEFTQGYLNLVKEYKVANDATNIDEIDEKNDSIILQYVDSPFLKKRNDLYNNILKYRQYALPETKYPFFYWIENRPDFFDAIKDFKDFISLRKILRNGIIEHAETLTKIEKHLINFLEIRQNTEKYQGLNKVIFNNIVIDIEKNQDLLAQIAAIITIINQYREFKNSE
ncbi:MAG: hypothetical protein ABFD07_03155, partial [Methanobacterium sp.]